MTLTAKVKVMRKDNEPEEPKPIATPGLVTAETIFEQIAEGQFLVYYRPTGETHVNNLVTCEGIGYVPIKRLPWPSACLPMPLSEQDDPPTKEQLIEICKAGKFQGEFGDNARLYDEIKDFFMEHLDVQNELLYDVYTTFVLMSWRIEDFKVIPYQMFLGPLSSGKTRGLECFKYLCYRSVMSSSMSAASIFRVLEAWHCTLLLDETEVYNRDAMVEVLALLNSGYRRGNVAIRIERLEGQVPQIAMFDVFGPKVLAGTEALAATLQSRAILSSMSKNVKHVRLFIDEEKAQELRNKLLLYRFRNLGVKADFDILQLNGYFTNSRVIELFISLLEVAPTEAIRNRLIKCMKGITQSRLDDEQQSTEAQVFEAVANSEDQVEAGKLSIKTVTERFNQGLSENEQVTPYFIGRQIASLGFEKCRMSHGLRGFFWDKERVERLRARYFPTVPKTASQTSLLSQMSPSMEKPCDPETVTGDSSDGSQSPVENSTPKNTVKGDISDVSDGSDAVSEGVGDSLLRCGNVDPPTEENLVCGHCRKWHTGACTFPGDPNCINPLNTAAKTCQQYDEQEATVQ